MLRPTYEWLMPENVGHTSAEYEKPAGPERAAEPRETAGDARGGLPPEVLAASGAANPDEAAARLSHLDAAGREQTVQRMQAVLGNTHMLRVVARARGGPVVQRQPNKPGGAKTKAPDAPAMVSAKYPNLVLPKDKLDILQKVFDNRAQIMDLQEEMKKYPTVASDDTAKREQIQNQINPLADFLQKNQALYVPTEGVLAGDILSKDQNKTNADREATFREEFYKTLIGSPTALAIGDGLSPDPLFTYQWGPNHWVVPNTQGKVTFLNWMTVQKFNVAYQAALLGDMTQLTAEMAEISRDAGKIYDMQGKKVGEIWGYLWNTTVKVGYEFGKLSGYYNDSRGQIELDLATTKSKGARITLLSPDNFLHVYSLDPNINSYDLRNPYKNISGSAADGYIYLYNKGGAVGNVVEIRTADGVTLEAGSNDEGAGWRCKEVLTEIEQFSIGAIIGDGFEDPSASMVFGQIVIGAIPIVGEVAAARDVAIGIHKMWTTGGKDGKLQTALALIGLIPLLGAGIKSGYKAIRGEIKAAGREAAKEAAARAIKEELAKSGRAAEEQVAGQILKDSEAVARAFGITVKDVEAQTKGLVELAEKALAGDADAAAKYATAMKENFTALGSNAASLVTVAGGDWAKVAKTLAQSSEGATLGKAMQAWRDAEMHTLEQKVAAKLADLGEDVGSKTKPKMEITGTPSFQSDVDISFLGADATAHRNAAIRAMEQEYGQGWRKLLDADIFADPSRMHLFEDPLKKLGGKAAKEIEKRIAKESELNVLAKMLKDGQPLDKVQGLAKEMGVDMALVTARQQELSKLSLDYLAGMLRRGGDDPAVKAEVEKMAKDMGVSMEDVVKQAATGDDLYRQLELKLDVLHKQFLEAEGDAAKQAAIAEEMAQIQGKLNAAIPGPYMTPGGVEARVTRREPGLRPPGAYSGMTPMMGYTAVLDELYMLEHALEGVEKAGFTEKSAKGMAKYADRLLVTAGQFGVDMSGKSTRPLFDTIAGLLERARLEKEPKPLLEKAVPFLNDARSQLTAQRGEIITAVKKNATAYLDTLEPAARASESAATTEWVNKTLKTLADEGSILARAEIRQSDVDQPVQPQATP